MIIKGRGRVGDIQIGCTDKPFIIAEMSGNHNQSLDRALEMVDVAADAGVNAVKLQTYTADTITLDIKENEFLIKDDNSLWGGRSLYDLYQEAHTPWDWHEPIMQRASNRGLLCFSTPFDETAVDFLETLDVPIYKVASFENSHQPLIKKIAATGKPVIVSTGMASIAELYETVSTLRDGGCENLVLLKCTSTYPASPIDSNVLTIPHLRQLFKCEVGLSDHTMGIGAAIAAVAHGATVIEKHFTLRRRDGGVDSAFSMEPDELKMLVVEATQAWQSLGDVTYGCTDVEKDSVVFRRSLYISRGIKKGERLDESNLRIVRPGLGLAPKYYEIVLGRKVSCDLQKGMALTWDAIE